MPTSKDFRGSGSHRQLFRPYWGPPAWHSHWVNERGKGKVWGKVDHKSPVNQSKGHTYTNPQPSYYLMHAHSHITLVGSHGQRFCPHWGSTAWHGHWSVTGKTCVPVYKDPLLQRRVLYSASASASSTQHMWELLAGNHTAALPQHVQGRQITGLGYACPLL